jgi:hypothetical protein
MNHSLILLFGMPRSGTSWIGKIFDSHPDTLYRHEPDSRGSLNFLPLFVRAAEFDGSRQALDDYLDALPRVRDEKVSASLPVFPKRYYAAPVFQLRRLLAYGAKAASRYLGPMSSPDVVNFERVRDLSVVWKSIESLGRLGWIVRVAPAARGIVILRHPCGFVSSVLRGEARRKFEDAKPSSEDWGLFEQLATLPVARERGLDMPALRAMSAVERLAVKWALYYEHAMAETAASGNILPVRYEDFCERPVETAERAFIHCGLAMNEQTRRFVDASTAGRQSNEYYTVFKNPLESANKWRKELSAEDAARVMSAVRGFRAGGYYSD